MKKKRKLVVAPLRSRVLLAVGFCFCCIGCERWKLSDGEQKPKEWFEVAAETAFMQLGKEKKDLSRQSTREYINALRDIARGDDVNKRYSNGDTLLMMSVRRNEINIVKRLVSLDYFADVNIADVNGNTPLIVASELGYQEVANTLVEAGAQIDSTNNVGKTALMACASKGEKEIALMLIDAGVKLDVKDKKGKLYGDYALDYGHQEIITIISERIKQ
jgi:ankyrin repeat protein